jgi:hypothetical protein
MGKRETLRFPAHWNAIDSARGMPLIIRKVRGGLANLNNALRGNSGYKEPDRERSDKKEFLMVKKESIGAAHAGARAIRRSRSAWPWPPCERTAPWADLCEQFEVDPNPDGLRESRECGNGHGALGFWAAPIEVPIKMHIMCIM